MPAAVRTTTASVLLLAAALVACSRSAAPPIEASAETGAGGAPQEIPWFDGTVEEAFAFAKANNKPVFLYWGAVWCPPCHEIKATVFRSHEFIDRSRLFVPVYLDGDTENAQKLGEQFGVVGYPTMLVFSPMGEEITRIPGGIDIQSYANVLDLSLANLQPVSALLARILDQGGTLTEDECRLTAYYSWDQNEKLLAGRSKGTVFSALAQACPEASTVERSILQMNALDAAIAAANDETAPVPVSAADKAAALALVERVLADPHLVRANLYAVLGSGPKITKAVTAPGSEARAALQTRFLAVLDRLANDDALFISDRLYTAIGKIRFERLDDPKREISPGLRASIQKMVALADQQTTDVYERQTVINAASYVLDVAGMKDEARQLLLAELDKSKQPYYFMVSLADIEQEAGNHAAAINWLKRAYDAATGPATRFQWGNYYVNGLVEMSPDDVGRIQTETVAVVRELEKSHAFYQRPKAQLQRLEKKLLEWGNSPERKAGLSYIHRNVQSICASIPAAEPARQTCDGFLAGA